MLLLSSLLVAKNSAAQLAGSDDDELSMQIKNLKRLKSNKGHVN